MIKRLPYGLMLVLCLWAATVRAQETLVPFDSAGRVERLDRNLEEKLQLFPEYPGFFEAALFRLPDSSYVLEIMYDDSLGRSRARRPLTGNEADELRWRVMQAVALRAPTAALDQSGRKRFIAGNLTLALGYHGWAIPYAVRASDAAAGGIYLVTAAAGYFVPFFATQHASMSRGMAGLGIYGGSRGILHGIMLALVAGAEENGRAKVTAGMVTSIAEEAAAVTIAQKTRLSDGDAVAIGVLGDFGAGIGVCLADVTGAFEGRDDSRVIGAWVLAGSAGGLTAGGILASRVDYTRGDAYVVRAAGWLGGLTAITPLTYGEPDHRAVSAAVIAGTTGGLALGHVLIRHRDFSGDQGALITLGEVAGGLFGVGIVTLTARGTDTDASVYWTGTTVGAAGGFAFSYWMLESNAPARPKRALDTGMDLSPRLPSLAGAPGFEKVPPPPDMLTATLHVHL
jgi:hypothetical protein